jgi:hypothetical protein
MGKDIAPMKSHPDWDYRPCQFSGEITFANRFLLRPWSRPASVTISAADEHGKL